MGLHIPLTISFEVTKLWDEWNIRGVILFSLLLQIVMIFMAPIRKYAGKNWVIFLVWCAYSLADATANFTVGHISNSQRNISNHLESNSNQRSELLAFWAPFLLLHLGGPDTITAFSLEDNQLWRRHLLRLVFQAVTVVYVFYRSLPNENLRIPTALVFIAGIIRYFERTLALFLASLDQFRDSMLKEPDAGANYAKLMEDFESKRKSKQDIRIQMSAKHDQAVKVSDGDPSQEKGLNHIQVVHYAHKYFETFKGLVVDLIFSSREIHESRDFFNRRTAEEALRIIEVELNFIYGTLYTKVEVVHSIAGYIFRSIAFGSVLAALGLFYFQAKKDEFQMVDVRITYILLLGAVALDVISFLILVFSDQTFASIKDPYHPHGQPSDSLFCCFLALKKPKWYPCTCSQKHNVLGTPLLFRRWSGSISTHNLIRYCLKSSLTCRIHEFPSMFPKVICFSGISEVTKIFGDYMTEVKRNIASVAQNCKPFKIIVSFTRSIKGYVSRQVLRITPTSIKDFVDEMTYVSNEPLTKELWEFIFEEIRSKSEFADTLEIAQRISSSRGEWVLANRWKLLKYVSDVPYDESLLLWHIATDLCYYSTEEDNPVNDENPDREISKILSDYMLYLLVFQPTMMSAVAGVGEIRYRDTCAEAERFFQSRGLGPNQHKKACNEILSVNTDAEPVFVKGSKSKSVLFDACMLAKELRNSMKRKERWNLLNRVWVEFASYAASRCSPSTHAQRVSKGGELINFFWLLTAHFGLGAQFQVNQGHTGAHYCGKEDTKQNPIFVSFSSN